MRPLSLVGCFVLATACGQLDELSDRLVMQSFLEGAQDGANEQLAAEQGGAELDTANDPNALTLGCLTITTDPTPLAQPLPASFSVTWEFASCPLGGGRTQSGARTIAVTIDPVSGDRDFAGSRDITRVMFAGDVVEIDSSATMHASGSFQSGDISRVINGTEHRVRDQANSDPIFDIDLTLTNLQVDDTYDTQSLALVRRVFNGTGSVEHNRADFTTTHVASHLTMERALCACPIAGTIAQTVEKDGNVERERTYTFTSDCGLVEMDDGDTLRLEACRR